MTKEDKYPYRELHPSYMRRLDNALKFPPHGKKMYRGKRYAIFDVYMHSQNAEKHARAIAHDIRDYSPYGAAAFIFDGRWAVGIRQWK